LNRRVIRQWPTVVAIVVELRAGGERKFDVPFEFEVLGTEVHSAFSYGLIGCIKLSSMLLQGHSTTFVLSAADDDGWKVWRVFDDDKRCALPTPSRGRVTGSSEWDSSSGVHECRGWC
jgi:hypothetical protein